MKKEDNFLHGHPGLQKKLNLDKNHVIVDREDWEKVISGDYCTEKMPSDELKKFLDYFTERNYRIMDGNNYVRTHDGILHDYNNSKSKLTKGKTDWVCKDCNGIWLGEDITCTCGHGIYTEKGDGGKYKKLIYIPIIGLFIGMVLSLKKSNALKLSGREAMFMMIIHLGVPEVVVLIIILITR